MREKGEKPVVQIQYTQQEADNALGLAVLGFIIILVVGEMMIWGVGGQLLDSLHSSSELQSVVKVLLSVGFPFVLYDLFRSRKTEILNNTGESASNM